MYDTPSTTLPNAVLRDRQYRAIFESAVDFAIVATGHDGLINDWNTGAQRIFGWSADEMIGASAEEIGQFVTQIMEDLGYRSAWATNAADALVELGPAEPDFDAVFSDVVMPGVMNGIDLANEIQRRRPAFLSC